MKKINKPISIKQNYLYQVIYQILAIIIPLVTAPYISRVLGAKSIGIQSLSYNVANYFVFFSMLGLATYGNRAIAIAREKKDTLDRVFSELFRIHVILNILVTILYFTFIYFFIRNDVYIYLISGIYVVFCVFDINWLFFGLEEFRITVIRNLIIKVLATVSIFIFVKTINDLFIYVLILSISTAISYIAIWPFLKRRVSFVRVSLKTAIVNHHAGLLLLFIPVFATSLYRNMSKVMIGFLSSKEQLGFFESSEKIITLIIGIISALGVVVLPRISNMIAKKETTDSVIKIMTDIALFNSFLSCALFFGIAGISMQFAPIFFGEGFAVVGSLLLYFSVTIPFLSLSNLIRMVYFIPYGKDRFYITSIIIGAIVNVSLNLLLISSYGSIGAVISIIVTEFIVMALHVWFSRDVFSISLLLKTTIPFIIIGFAMFLFVFWFGYNYVNGRVTFLLMQIISGIIIYLFLSLLYLILFNKDLFLKITSIIFKKNL